MFKQLNYPHKLLFFGSGILALDYFNCEDINSFLILSDINMPLIDGFALQERVFTHKKLSMKCIPYLFFTTHADEKSVMDAYGLSVQGYFIKPTSFRGMSECIRKIVEYWQDCYSPGKYLA